MAKLEHPTKTLEEPADEARPGLSAVHPYLVLVVECGRPAAGGARHSLLDLDRVTIGRGTERCHTRSRSGDERVLEIRLSERYASSTHALLKRAGLSWSIEDAGSTNGTLVNGVRVDRRVLEDGDLIEVGRTFFRFRSALPTPPGTAIDQDTRTTAWEAPALVTLLPALAADFRRLAEVARSRVPVVLTGATGTGKELAARAVHSMSGRPGAFVAVNCGVLTESLLESRLFGHVRGAFSGATRDEIGFVRASHEGTLFLDEVSSLSAAGQAALLRVLQEGEVVPLGRSQPIQVDLRVIAASHERLEELVDRGRLRSDLVGRLMGYSLKLPTLVERLEDLGVLLGALLAKHGPPGIRLSPAAVRLLHGWKWSRNIRELEQAIRLALATQSDGCIQANDLPEELARVTLESPAFECRLPKSAAPPAIGDDHRSPETLESEIVARMQDSGGNISEVARAMHCSRAQIHRWLKRFGLRPEAFRQRESRLQEGTEDKLGPGRAASVP